MKSKIFVSALMLSFCAASFLFSTHPSEDNDSSATLEQLKYQVAQGEAGQCPGGGNKMCIAGDQWARTPWW